jgi:hypothetical protein
MRLKREASAAAGRAQATAGTSVVGHGAATGCAPMVGRPVLAPLSVNKMPGVQASNTPSKVTTSLQTPRATAEADISGAVGLPAGGFARPPISASRLQHSLLSVHHASNLEASDVLHSSQGADACGFTALRVSANAGDDAASKFRVRCCGQDTGF